METLLPLSEEFAGLQPSFHTFYIGWNMLVNVHALIGLLHHF